ncbi:MAG: type II toxin-antitoxin system RelE/ParE family toxin [Alphaproteobacteria bacterium]|nr:type II toxin-antitoxin system RelE/ParE family toxin [Alphaproteobacteria bacterium]
MKTVVFAPAALDRLADIFAWTAERFGEAQAAAYAARLARRLEALAGGDGPKPRLCERLMQGVREASGLGFYREGSHYLILRERPEVLEVVEIFHERMNIEAHLERLGVR